MVINIIAARTMKEMTIFIIPQSPPVTRYKIQFTKAKIIAPINKPSPAIAKPDKLPFDKKAMRAIKPNVPAVMPKASPRIDHSIKMVNEESNTPMNTVYKIAGTNNLFPL